MSDADAVELSYSEVGASLETVLPVGYHHLELIREFPRDRFDDAASRLSGWQVHRDAGLVVRAGADRVAVDVDARLAARLGPVRIVAPVRVVAVVAEPDRRGFVYATLPGHPETGEEAFLLTRDAEVARFTVRAFSRPARWYSRIGGPLTWRVQRRIVRRYLAAITGP